MRNYQVITTPLENEVIQYEENGVLFTIPKDEANSDYQRYLRWLNGEEENEGGLK